MKQKRAAVLLAEGFEEVEAITPIDFLRRAGVEVVIAGIGGKVISGAHGVPVQVNQEIADLSGDFDVVVIPGGMPGSTNVAESSEASALITKLYQDKKIIAAICAAPAVVLAPLGVLDGRKATCYPGCEAGFAGKVSASSDRVVVDDHVITSKGPGTAAEFSLKIIEMLVDKQTAANIAEGTIQ